MTLTMAIRDESQDFTDHGILGMKGFWIQLDNKAIQDVNQWNHSERNNKSPNAFLKTAT